MSPPKSSNGHRHNDSEATLLIQNGKHNDEREEKQQAWYFGGGGSGGSRFPTCMCLAFGVILMVLVAVIVHIESNRDETETERLFRVRSTAADKALEYLNRVEDPPAETNHSTMTAVSPRCESTLLLIRHCEKFGPYVESEGSRNQHCSYIGYERSRFLATLFGNDTGTRWPHPSGGIYALTTDRSDHLNFREWETVVPLSEKSGVPIELADHPDLATRYLDRLRTGTLCGKLTVVCWKHSYMVELATALGCGPHHGCPGEYPADSFDEVWQLKYVFHPMRKSSSPIKNRKDEIGENETGEYNRTTPRGWRPRGRRRRLMPGRSKEGWNLFATVSRQDFDPLAYSKKMGDYPPGGTDRGGRWINDKNDEV